MKNPIIEEIKKQRQSQKKLLKHSESNRSGQMVAAFYSEPFESHERRQKIYSEFEKIPQQKQTSENMHQSPKQTAFHSSSAVSLMPMYKHKNLTKQQNQALQTKSTTGGSMPRKSQSCKNINKLVQNQQQSASKNIPHHFVPRKISKKKKQGSNCVSKQSSQNSSKFQHNKDRSRSQKSLRNNNSFNQRSSMTSRNKKEQTNQNDSRQKKPPTDKKPLPTNYLSSLTPKQSFYYPEETKNFGSKSFFKKKSICYEEDLKVDNAVAIKKEEELYQLLKEKDEQLRWKSMKILSLEDQNAKLRMELQDQRKKSKMKDTLLDDCEKQVYHLKEMMNMLVGMVEKGQHVGKKVQIETVPENQPSVRSNQSTNHSNKSSPKITIKLPEQPPIVYEDKEDSQHSFQEETKNNKQQQRAYLQSSVKKSEQDADCSLSRLNIIEESQQSQNQIEQNSSFITHIDKLDEVRLQKQFSTKKQQQNSHTITPRQQTFNEKILLQFSEVSQKSEMPSQDESSFSSLSSLIDNGNLMLEAKRQIESTRKDIEHLQERINNVAWKGQNLEVKNDKQTQRHLSSSFEKSVDKEANQQNEKEACLQKFVDKGIEKGVIRKNGNNERMQNLKKIVNPVHRLININQQIR